MFYTFMTANISFRENLVHNGTEEGGSTEQKGDDDRLGTKEAPALTGQSSSFKADNLKTL